MNKTRSGPFFENPDSYFNDSLNTRVPPMNISGKKSNPFISKLRMEPPSPLTYTKSYQYMPKPNILIRGESPQPSFRYYEPERVSIPSPMIRNMRSVVYRPALMNLNNRVQIPHGNLNPFEVVEQLFLDESCKEDFFLL